MWRSRQLSWHGFSEGTNERNILRAMFGRPEYQKLFNNYEEDAWKTMALFRATSDRYVQEPWFKDLVAELKVGGFPVRVEQGGAEEYRESYRASTRSGDLDEVLAAARYPGGASAQTRPAFHSRVAVQPQSV